jgi:aminoglycoside 2'-N-acetyltransferase I
VRVDISVARSEELSDDTRAEIRQLLTSAFEGAFSQDDWLHTLGGWHVIARDDELVAHAALVERTLDVGGRKLRTAYVEGVATATSMQRRGIGTTIMRRIGDLVQMDYELGALSTSSHAFYEPLGWMRWCGPSYVLTAHGTERTPDEDDCIMVLLCDVSVDLDLALPICCEARSGDDW